MTTRDVVLRVPKGSLGNVSESDSKEGRCINFLLSPLFCL